MTAWSIIVQTRVNDLKYTFFDVVSQNDTASTIESYFQEIPNLSTHVEVDEVSDIAVTFSGVLYGPGTIKDANRAEQYISAGASFVVGASFFPEVADVCKKHQVPYIPGVMTPTEIETAVVGGASALKIFPAQTSAFAKSIQIARHDDLPTVASSGPTVETLSEWLEVVDAVVLGRELVNIGLVDQDYAALESSVRKLVNDKS